jgi:hypothetical protein
MQREKLHFAQSCPGRGFSEPRRWARRSQLRLVSSRFRWVDVERLAVADMLVRADGWIATIISYSSRSGYALTC